MAAPTPPRTRWRFAVLFGIAGALIVGIVVLAFAWPAATAEARNLPVGIAGPSSEVSAVEQRFAQQDPDPISFVEVTSRADAVQRIRSREIAGAVLLGERPEVLTASAAGSAQNQLLRGIGTTLQAQVATAAETALIGKVQQLGSALAAAQQTIQSLGQRRGTAARSVPVDSAVCDARRRAAGHPDRPDHRRGAAVERRPDRRRAQQRVLPARARRDARRRAGLPARRRRRTTGDRPARVLRRRGMVVTLVLQTWLHVLQGSWFANAAAFGLAMLATAAVVVGFELADRHTRHRRRRRGQPADRQPDLGDPLTPAQFLAGPWGAVGQWFVPGAASTLVRSLSYFPDADTAPQWWTLAAWAAGGILLTLIGHFRSSTALPLPAAELDPQPAAA